MRRDRSSLRSQQGAFSKAVLWTISFSLVNLTAINKKFCIWCFFVTCLTVLVSPGTVHPWLSNLHSIGILAVGLPLSPLANACGREGEHLTNPLLFGDFSSTSMSVLIVKAEMKFLGLQ